LCTGLCALLLEGKKVLMGCFASAAAAGGGGGWWWFFLLLYCNIVINM